MKKLIITFLSVFLLVGCTPAEVEENVDDNGANELTESTDGAVMGGGLGIANPIKSYETAAEIEAATGILLNIPEGAENTAFSTITGTIAQARFTLDGVEYNFRASKNAPEASLHGIYADVVSTESFETAGGLTVTSANLGDQYSVCEWELDGVFYAVSRDGVADMSAVVGMIAE